MPPLHRFPLNLLLSIALLTPSLAQTPPPTTETQADLLARLTPDQKSRFDSAARLFNSGDFTAALPQFRQLLTDLPNDPILAKYTAEAALNTGDTTYALSLIAPILQTNLTDWQAHTLRARIAAQTNDAATRDSEIARIAALRQQGLIPAALRQYPIERVKVGDRSLLIFQSLFPWGRYKVYNYAQLFDPTGKLDLRLTSESADFDQVQFAKDHPAEAARGDRLFSFDGYRDGGTNAQGQHTETQMLFGFVEKQPTYDQVRARFLQIASGESKLIASNTHPIP